MGGKAKQTGEAVVTAEDRAHEQRLATYNQNSETFRSLNALMWQIPLIAMSLTGGLWFGVSKAESTPFFQFWLLLLTAAGDTGLAIVLTRLRYIMERYLKWLEKFDKDAFVEAPGVTVWEKPFLVRRVFQIMLGLAAIASLLLMIAPAQQLGLIPRASSDASVAFYDRQARDLADAYEALPFETAHPELVPRLTKTPPLRILDVGAGTGRDAAWMAAAGHQVTAVEPSVGMLRLAKELHPHDVIRWSKDSLPALSTLKAGAQYDLIVLSAVWMHVHPADRAAAIARLDHLLAPGGTIYFTLRSGPSEPEREMYPTSIEQLRALAAPNGLTVQDLGERTDLLARPGVAWRAAVLSDAAARRD